MVWFYLIYYQPSCKWVLISGNRSLIIQDYVRHIHILGATRLKNRYESLLAYIFRYRYIFITITKLLKELVQYTE